MENYVNIVSGFAKLVYAKYLKVYTHHVIIFD